MGHYTVKPGITIVVHSLKLKSMIYISINRKFLSTVVLNNVLSYTFRVFNILLLICSHTPTNIHSSGNVTISIKYIVFEVLYNALPDFYLYILAFAELKWGKNAQ